MLDCFPCFNIYRANWKYYWQGSCKKRRHWRIGATIGCWVQLAGARLGTSGHISLGSGLCTFSGIKSCSLTVSGKHLSKSCQHLASKGDFGANRGHSPRNRQELASTGPNSTLQRPNRYPDKANHQSGGIADETGAHLGIIAEIRDKPVECCCAPWAHEVCLALQYKRRGETYCKTHLGTFRAFPRSPRTFAGLAEGRQHTLSVQKWQYLGRISEGKFSQLKQRGESKQEVTTVKPKVQTARSQSSQLSLRSLERKKVLRQNNSWMTFRQQ